MRCQLLTGGSVMLVIAAGVAQTPSWTQASPTVSPPARPVTPHHAFVVYDSRTGQVYTASNWVSVRLR